MRNCVLGVLTMMLAAGCDGLVGLAPPSETGDGGPLEGGDEGGGGFVDAYAPLPADAGEDSDATGQPGSMSMAAPIGTWDFPNVTGIAFAGTANTLYVLQQEQPGSGPVSLYRTLLGNEAPFPTPSLRWSGESSGVSLSALCPAPPYYVYFGDSGGTTNEIRRVDGEADEQGLNNDPTTPEVVVDIAAALPGTKLGPIIGMACDETSLFWTQQVGSTTALLRYDLGDAGTTVSVVLTAAAMDSLNLVALDSVYAYTVGTMGGTLYAIPREADDAGAAFPVVSSVLTTSPIVARNGSVYYVQGSAFATSGALFYAAPTRQGQGMSFFNEYPVSPFAFDGQLLFFGSGPNIYDVTPTDGAQTLVGTPGASDIAGVAAGNGYAAYYNAEVLGVSAESF
jgi:hypothetical protein